MSKVGFITIDLSNSLSIERQHRLLDAIETGVAELDETVQRRAQHLKTAREALLIELAGLLVDEIVVTEKTATMKGSYSALVQAASMDEIKVGHLKQVPTSMSYWCARQESNL